jgi:hypothetical protein
MSAGEILTQFYDEQKEDSIRLFMQYWDKKCQENRNIFAIQTCLAIKNERFNNADIDSTFFQKLVLHQNRRYYQHYPSWRFGISQNHLLDSLIKKIINDNSRNNLSPDEKYLLIYFASDDIGLKDLEKSKYSNTKLSKLYQTEMDRVERKMEARFGFTFGIIAPQGDMAVIDVKPSLRIFLGRRLRRHHWNGTIGVDFGAHADSILVSYNDDIVTSKDFTQVYFGAEYNYDFIQKNRMAVHWLGGIGFNQMSTLFADNDYGEDAVIKRSLNLNTGLGLGFEYKKNNGVYGLQCRYNFVNYKRNTGETSLAGNFVEIRLVVGFRAPHQRMR